MPYIICAHEKLIIFVFHKYLIRHFSVNWNVYVCVHSAFDTLAKVFSPPEAGVGQSMADKSQCVGGTTIQLIGRDQETPIIEVEGPLLTDSHVGFKVSVVFFLFWWS